MSGVSDFFKEIYGTNNYKSLQIYDRNTQSPLGVRLNKAKLSDQEYANTLMAMKQRKLMVFEYKNNPKEKPITISMYINPENFQVQMSKVINAQKTRGGIFYQHWGDENPKISFSGSTGLSGMRGIKKIEQVYFASGTPMKYKNTGSISIKGTPGSFLPLNYEDKLYIINNILKPGEENSSYTETIDNTKKINNENNNQSIANTVINMIKNTLLKTTQEIDNLTNLSKFGYQEIEIQKLISEWLANCQKSQIMVTQKMYTDKVSNIISTQLKISPQEAMIYATRLSGETNFDLINQDLINLEKSTSTILSISTAAINNLKSDNDIFNIQANNITADILNFIKNNKIILNNTLVNVLTTSIGNNFIGLSSALRENMVNYFIENIDNKIIQPLNSNSTDINNKPFFINDIISGFNKIAQLNEYDSNIEKLKQKTISWLNSNKNAGKVTTKDQLKNYILELVNNSKLPSSAKNDMLKYCDSIKLNDYLPKAKTPISKNTNVSEAENGNSYAIDYQKKMNYMKELLKKDIDNYLNYLVKWNNQEKSIIATLRNGINNYLSDENNIIFPRKITIYFLNRAYVGHFDSFNYKMDANTPLITYDINFTVEYMFTLSNEFNDKK
jgi:hypothetical protein